MKVLLTGASGFLGKWVLRELLASASVSTVQVVSRSKSSHPDPRVSVIRKDIADPSLLNDISQRPDVAIHLAGLYRFGSRYSDNYRSNVLGTQNLLESLRAHAPTRILHASTYAVGIGFEELSNSRLPELPAREHAYAHTKALAERLMEQAGDQLRHSVEIFRLGVLVGDSENGAYEKLDGPYGLTRRLFQFARHVPDHMPVWLPVDPEALIPLVAVDEAARVIAQAALGPDAGGVRYRALYRSDSVRVGELVASLLEEVAIRSGRHLNPIFRPVPHPDALRILEGVLGTRAEDLAYAQWRARLETGEDASRLSPWQALKPAFFKGVAGA
jgi:nucleoside-diphosphate-sugar epimerase